MQAAELERDLSDELEVAGVRGYGRGSQDKGRVAPILGSKLEQPGVFRKH